MSDRPQLPNLYSVTQLARSWGVSRATVYALIHLGKLEAVALGTHGLRVTREAVERFLAERARGGQA